MHWAFVASYTSAEESRINKKPVIAHSRSWLLYRLRGMRQVPLSGFIRLYSAD